MTNYSESTTNVNEVPQALRISFLFHFAIDMIVALPLFFAPREVLSLFGWIAIDPFASRLVAAALFAIGIESLLARNASAATFKGMLQLKLVWSAFATAGLAWSILEGGLRSPSVGWLLSSPPSMSCGGIGLFGSEVLKVPLPNSRYG